MAGLALEKLSEIECRSIIFDEKQCALIFFIAEWCAPCKEMAKTYQSVFERLNNSIKIAFVELDEVALLAAECGVVSIPTAALFINGRLTDKIVGTRSFEEICKITEKGLGEQNGAKGF